MITIDVVTKSKAWSAQDNIEQFIEQTCQQLVTLTPLQRIINDDVELELSVSLVSDTQIKKLNHEFRGKDKATNVLSFPALDEELIRQHGLEKVMADTPYIFLGDIIISYHTLQKESLAQKKEFANHVTHLLLHSLLHLIGFDHEDDKQAQEMENLEINILSQLNIPNPYLI